MIELLIGAGAVYLLKGKQIKSGLNRVLNKDENVTENKTKQKGNDTMSEDKNLDATIWSFEELEEMKEAYKEDTVDALLDDDFEETRGSLAMVEEINKTIEKKKEIEKKKSSLLGKVKQGAKNTAKKTGSVIGEFVAGFKQATKG